MKVVHDWLKEYLGEATPSASEIENLLTFHSFEIEGIETVGEDEVIDVDVLPNRSADCLSHRGIAREIATLIDKPLAHDPLAVRPDMPLTNELKITIVDKMSCRHFDLALIKGVVVKESPEWLKRRLKALGQRSINNVVDATNYVMLGLGQPTHVYDADKFPKDGDGWHFGVRFGETGKKIKTLGGEEYEVDETIQLITNEADGSYAGIAGIKGGAYAELTPSTVNVIVEAGNFEPSVTRKASQKLRLQTDASKRFENGVSTNIIPYAIAEVVNLILDLAGGELAGYAHARPVEIKNVAVTVELPHINALLGLSLSESEVEKIFDRVGFTVTKTGPNQWEVVAPFERTDINIAEDVIEEVGRIYGYDKVISVVPPEAPLTEYNQRHYYSEVVRDCLVALGYSEVITSSFRKKDSIQLLNALASDKSYLRSSLIKNITEVLDKNAGLSDLLGTQDTRVFEIGTVFKKTEGGISEHVSLCFGVRLKASGYAGKEEETTEKIYAAVAAVRSALGVDKIDAVEEKGVAEMNFSELLSSLPAVSKYTPVPPAKEIVYQPFSVYPSISRDIALWVPGGTDANEIETVLNQHAGPLRVRTTLFDEFSKEGRTSFAFRFVFQSFEKTLTDEETKVHMENVYAAVAAQGWEVR